MIVFDFLQEVVLARVLDVDSIIVSLIAIDTFLIGDAIEYHLIFGYFPSFILFGSGLRNLGKDYAACASSFLGYIRILSVKIILANTYSRQSHI